MIFGFLVENDDQPKQYDIYKVPTTKVIHINICNKTAKAFGHDPRIGGIPPYHWIEEKIALELGYNYDSDTIPIVEYYGFFNQKRTRVLLFVCSNKRKDNPHF